MQTYYSRATDPTKILTRRELAAVLADLKRKAPRSKNTRLNLVLFRLAVCCGLRASEIAKLRLTDVCAELHRPHVRIRNGSSKGGRPRMVPLWWDAGTLADLASWKNHRMCQAAARRPVLTNRSSSPSALAESQFRFPATRCESGSALHARC